MKTVTNMFHASVRKCCASCRHRDVENDGTRICQLMQLKVAPAFVCTKWQMSDGLQNAGMSGGVVKKLTGVVIQ